MEYQIIQNQISAIENDWLNLSQESDNDSENFHFISVKSTALKLKIHTLRELLKEQIEFNKETKLKYQRLVTSLEKMEATMSFKMKTDSGLNHDYIKSVLTKVKNIEPEIIALREYITG